MLDCLRFISTVSAFLMSLNLYLKACGLQRHDLFPDENRKRGVDGGAVGMAIMKLIISHYPARMIGRLVFIS